MASSFQSSKKCSNCGQWSDWNMEVTDRCQHCGALLSDKSSLDSASRETEPEVKEGFQLQLIQIYPTDSWFVVGVKRIVQALQISFVAIVSFIIWFLTLLAG